ncbi:MAG TPA: hypothetical protein VMV72_01075 [Verrucomicrobiae bacterium]|nr:hypothetical protein [Verrucomicrobiae bacterium]
MHIQNDRRLFPPMVKLAMVMGLAAALLAGCAGSGATAPAAAPAGARLEPTAPDTGAATVASVNSELGFVVVDFASQTLPPLGTRVNIYRGDKRVAIVRITEPVRAPLATADIVEGEVRVGDEAR